MVMDILLLAGNSNRSAAVKKQQLTAQQLQEAETAKDQLTTWRNLADSGKLGEIRRYRDESPILEVNRRIAGECARSPEASHERC